MTSIEPIKVLHMNMIMSNFDETVDHFTGLYGAKIMVLNPQMIGRPYRASEMVPSAVGSRDRIQAHFRIAGMMFSVQHPKVWALHTRPGHICHGLEHKVVDLAAARKAVAERGLRITSDNPTHFFTNPMQTFGIHFEYFDLDFPNDTPASYWRDEHPMGMTGFKGYTVAVGASDLKPAALFFEDFFSGKRLYEKERRAIAARAIGLQVADYVVELLAPTGDGVLRRHLERIGQGIYSVVFGVRDLDQAKRYMAGKGVTLVPGTVPDRLAVPAEANLGVVFEFQA